MTEPCKNCKKSKGKSIPKAPLLTEQQSNYILRAIHIIDLSCDNKSELLSHYSFWEHLGFMEDDGHSLKKAKEYLYAIGLIWFYQNWVVSKESFRPSSAYITVKKWDEKNMDMWTRILKWWIANSDDFYEDLAIYLSIVLRRPMNV